MTQPLDLNQTFWTPIGTFLFPALVTPTRDLSNNEVWACGLHVPLDESDQLLAIVEAVLTDARRSMPGFPKTDKFKDSRGREDFLNMPYRQATKKDGEARVPIDGLLQWSFKRKTTTKKGNPASRPVILDPRGSIVADPPEIGYGSKGRIAFKAFAYDNASKGVGFYLVGAQVSSLAAGELDGADAIDGDWVPGAAAPAQSGTTGTAPGWNPQAGDFDDEVPF